MRWIKVLAIGAAVVVVLIVVSSLLRLVYYAVLALAVAAVIAIVLKARSQLRARREVKDSEQQRTAAPPRVPRQPLETPPPRPARLEDDIEAELARLKRELE